MKSIVLDGERIAEAIQKTRDNLINGEYDNNDLILRGDALKAIRKRCISEHLPFKSNTPEGERVLDALVAVHQVKPYKEACCGWISVKDRCRKQKKWFLHTKLRLILCLWRSDFRTQKNLSTLAIITRWMPSPTGCHSPNRRR